MVHSAGGKLQRSFDIVSFKIGVLRENFLVAHPRRKEIQNIAHPEAQPTDARPPAALAGL